MTQFTSRFFVNPFCQFDVTSEPSGKSRSSKLQKIPDPALKTEQILQLGMFPETNIFAPFHINGWKMILSFWGPAHLQVRKTLVSGMFTFSQWKFLSLLCAK